MFAPRFHRLHRLRGLHELRQLGHVADPVVHWADDFTTSRPWRRSFARRRRGPSILTLLLAGLAVFAFAKLTAASSRSRSTAEKFVLGALLLVAAAWVMSFRRRRYW